MKQILHKIASFILRVLRKLFHKKVHIDVDHDGKTDITVHLDE